MAKIKASGGKICASSTVGDTPGFTLITLCQWGKEGGGGVFEFLLHSLTERSATRRYPQPTLAHKDYFKRTETSQI